MVRRYRVLVSRGCRIARECAALRAAAHLDGSKGRIPLACTWPPVNSRQVTGMLATIQTQSQSGRLLPRAVKHLTQPGGTQRVPGDGSDLFGPISRLSQAFASFQSRFTLWGEIFRTPAVSSTLNPPKKRSSITRALRESICANALSESSKAINTRPRCGDMSRSSSRLRRGAGPPRRPEARARAASTRIRRITWAATAKKCTRSCQMIFEMPTSRR